MVTHDEVVEDAVYDYEMLIQTLYNHYLTFVSGTPLSEDLKFDTYLRCYFECGD